jgi:hypothetical protein
VLKILLPLTAAAVTLFTTACTTAPAKKDDFERLNVSLATTNQPPEFGKGLNGRLVNGKRTYTVMMMLSVSKEGRVTDVEMIRADAPQRLQWAAMQAMRRMQYPRLPEPREMIQVIRFEGLKVDPG